VRACELSSKNVLHDDDDVDDDDVRIVHVSVSPVRRSKGIYSSEPAREAVSERSRQRRPPRTARAMPTKSRSRRRRRGRGSPALLPLPPLPVVSLFGGESQRHRSGHRLPRRRPRAERRAASERVPPSSAPR